MSARHLLKLIVGERSGARQKLSIDGSMLNGGVVQQASLEQATLTEKTTI